MKTLLFYTISTSYLSHYLIGFTTIITINQFTHLLIAITMNLEEVFNKWLYEACEHKSKLLRGKLEPHDLYQRVNLTDAKLSFLDGVSPYDYSKEI